MLNGIKRQGIVGKNGKTEMHASEFAEGTIVEVIVLTEQENAETDDLQLVQDNVLRDETAYLLSTESNRRHLMTAIQQVEEKNNLVSFTPEEWSEEWNEKHNIHSGASKCCGRGVLSGF